jgi:tRNA nucleotidyltransferase (CCA-adding enzyme)
MAKHYKNKNEVFIQINEAKLHSPIVLIDPTYKERNALAALSNETLIRLQNSSKAFIKRPSNKFFVLKEIDENVLKKNVLKKKMQFFVVEISTDKQRGDIAGTKLKKFAEVLHREIGNMFEINGFDFSYGGEHSGKIYVSSKPKKEIIKIGPPIHMKKHVLRFKMEHRNTFVKNKRVHAKLMPVKDAINFMHSWKLANKKMLEQMHITSMIIY